MMKNECCSTHGHIRGGSCLLRLLLLLLWLLLFGLFFLLSHFVIIGRLRISTLHT